MSLNASVAQKQVLLYCVLFSTHKKCITFQDIETYKSAVKDEILEWTAALKARNISDWMVVVVVYEESKVKSKLLRTSVFDRVKSDFCSKHTDR